MSNKDNFSTLLENNQILKALKLSDIPLNSNDSLLFLVRINSIKKRKKQMGEKKFNKEFSKIKNSIYFLSGVTNDALNNKTNLEEHDFIFLDLYRLQNKVIDIKKRGETRSIKTEKKFNKYSREYAHGAMSQKRIKLFLDKIEPKLDKALQT